MTDRRVQVRLPNAPARYSAQEEAGFRRSVAQAIQDAVTRVTDLNIGGDIQELTSPDGAADYVAVYDATDGLVKKMLLSTLGGGTHTHDISAIVNVTGHGVVGRITGATGVLEHIAAGTGTVLRRDAGDLGFGTVPLNAITVTGVTQHEGSLSIAWGQLTGVPSTFTPSAHTHTESEITDGTILARVADAETISGAWTITGLLKLSGSAISATTTTPIQRVVMWDSSATNLEYVNDAPLSNGDTFIFAYKSTAGGYQWAATSESIFPWADLTAAETVSGAWTFTGKVTFDQGTLDGFAPAFTRNIEALYDGSSATGNDLGILGFVRQTVATTGGPQGLEGYALTSHTTGAVALAIGTVGNAESHGAGTVTDLRGGSFTVGISGTGNVTAGKGIHIAGGYETSTGNFVDLYGLFIDDQTAGTTNYAIYTKAGLVSIGDDLYLRDSTTYPTDGLLYRTSTGLVVGTAASVTGDIPYNIDGSAWGYISKGASPDGYVLKLVSGIPQWDANNASDADTLDGQHGAYYLALANATGTLALTKLTLIPEGSVLAGTAGGNAGTALDASWIDAGTFPGSAYTFTTNLTVGGKLTVDNDIFLSNGSNGAIKYDGTLVEFVPTAGDGQVAGGWARGLEWNGGGASVNAAQVGTLGSADSINYVYISADGTSGTSDYNSNNTWRWLSGGSGIMWMGGTQPEIRLYESDAPADEKYWRIYASSGNLGFGHMSDASAGTDIFMTFYRSGNDIDYGQFDIHDWRMLSDGVDAQYFRFYSNSTTGTTNLEMRRSSDSKMKWEIEAPASGDFYLYNWNYQLSAQDTWIWGDASSGELTFDGQRITITPQIRASATYNNGDQSGLTLNVNWDNGNSQRCEVNTGNATISVNQATAYQGTSYTMEVTNVHSTTGRTVTWNGVSQWIGSAPTATIDAGKMTVVQLYVARNRAGTNYIIGSCILDNVTVPT